jgi:glutathione S-transferase
MSLPKLTYFAVRGRAETPRMILAEAGIAYEEANFEPSKPGERPPSLTALVESGKLPFNQVPLWEEDGLTLVQSDGIVRHLARKHGFYGSGLREAALCDLVAEGVKDVAMEVFKLMFMPPADRPGLRAKLVEAILPRWLGHFEKLLAPSTTGFFVGSSLTYADLAVFGMLELLQDNHFDPTKLSAYPKLAAFKARIAERPRLSAYLTSSKRHPPFLLPS